MGSHFQEEKPPTSPNHLSLPRAAQHELHRTKRKEAGFVFTIVFCPSSLFWKFLQSLPELRKDKLAIYCPWLKDVWGMWRWSGCDICHPINHQGWLGWSAWLGRCPLPPSRLQVRPSQSCVLGWRIRPSLNREGLFFVRGYKCNCTLLLEPPDKLSRKIFLEKENTGVRKGVHGIRHLIHTYAEPHNGFRTKPWVPPSVA